MRGPCSALGEAHRPWAAGRRLAGLVRDEGHRPWAAGRFRTRRASPTIDGEVPGRIPVAEVVPAAPSSMSVLSDREGADRP